MPKGVEHLTASLTFASQSGVFLPLMPKGVEHKAQLKVRTNLTSVPSVDAERR